jgi:AcrR family transcriptional regulator
MVAIGENMPKGIPLTEEYRLDKRAEIAHATAELIFHQGFNETSLNQIAQKTGIGKSTIYDYFSSKDEIILLLLDEPLAEVRSQAEDLAAGAGTPAERITQILEMHLEVLLRDKAFIFKLSFEFQRLPLDVQARHEDKRQVYQELLRGLVREGISEGSFRPADPDITVKILLSILSSIILTARPTGTPMEMLNEGLDLIFKGLEE